MQAALLEALDAHLSRTKRRVIDIFESYDRDSDGYMDSSNLIALAADLGTTLPLHEAVLIIKAISGGEGDGHLISYLDLVAALRLNRAKYRATDTALITNRIQASPSPPPPAVDVYRSFSRDLLKAEMDYIKKLKLLIDSYITPLAASVPSPNPILSKEDFSTIFDTIDFQGLYTFHKSCLEKFTMQDNSSTSEPSIDAVIHSYSDLKGVFKIYRKYYACYMRAISCVDMVRRRNVRFAEFLHSTRLKSSGNSLVYLFNVPVNHCIAYERIWSEIYKLTPPDDGKFTAVEAILGAAGEACTASVIETVGNYNELMDVYLSLGEPLNLLTVGRNYAHDVTAVVHTHQGALRAVDTTEEYHIVLVTDSIIFVNSASSAFFTLPISDELDVHIDTDSITGGLFPATMQQGDQFVSILFDSYDARSYFMHKLNEVYMTTYSSGMCPVTIQSEDDMFGDEQPSWGDISVDESLASHDDILVVEPNALAVSATVNYVVDTLSQIGIPTTCNERYFTALQKNIDGGNADPFDFEIPSSSRKRGESGGGATVPPATVAPVLVVVNQLASQVFALGKEIYQVREENGKLLERVEAMQNSNLELENQLTRVSEYIQRDIEGMESVSREKSAVIDEMTKTIHQLETGNGELRRKLDAREDTIGGATKREFQLQALLEEKSQEAYKSELDTKYLTNEVASLTESVKEIALENLDTAAKLAILKSQYDAAMVEVGEWREILQLVSGKMKVSRDGEMATTGEELDRLLDTKSLSGLNNQTASIVAIRKLTSSVSDRSFPDRVVRESAIMKQNVKAMKHAAASIRSSFATWSDDFAEGIKNLGYCFQLVGTTADVFNGAPPLPPSQRRDPGSQMLSNSTKPLSVSGRQPRAKAEGGGGGSNSSGSAPSRSHPPTLQAATRVFLKVSDYWRDTEKRQFKLLEYDYSKKRVSANFHDGDKCKFNFSNVYTSSVMDSTMFVNLDGLIHRGLAYKSSSAFVIGLSENALLGYPTHNGMWTIGSTYKTSLETLFKDSAPVGNDVRIAISLCHIDAEGVQDLLVSATGDASKSIHSVIDAAAFRATAVEVKSFKEAMVVCWMAAENRASIAQKSNRSLLDSHSRMRISISSSTLGLGEASISIFEVAPPRRPLPASNSNAADERAFSFVNSSIEELRAIVHNRTNGDSRLLSTLAADGLDCVSVFIKFGSIPTSKQVTVDLFGVLQLGKEENSKVKKHTIVMPSNRAADVLFSPMRK